MNKWGWSFLVSFNGRTAEVVWKEHFFEDKSMGYWLNVVHPGSENSFTDYDALFTEKGVREAAVAFRVNQLQVALDPFSVTTENLKETIVNLFQRSRQGEYLGQYSNSNLYIQDVARILDYPVNMVHDLVDELIKEKRIGVTGAILIPFEAYEEAFVSWFEATGHRKLTVSDWGYWSCGFCGQHGEPEDNLTPAQVPCKP